MTASATLRATAARVLFEVSERGRTLEAAMVFARIPAAQRPAVQALSYGAVRRYPRHCECLRLLQGSRYAATDALLRALLVIGLEQLADDRTPPHAAVMETVEATRALGMGRAAGFVNALLRRAAREWSALSAALDRDVATRHAFPDWLAAAIAHDWPTESERILAASSEPPPLWLRINRRRIEPDDYRARLDELGIGHRLAPFAPEAVRLDVPLDVLQIPGFADGLVSVQDAAAQLAPRLLAPAPGMRVLDACAAPGGKACHLLELEPTLDLVTVEKDGERARRIDQNLARLGLVADQKVADVADPDSWWDGRLFDRILLDTPCSGTGVIRRHPDIKLLRRPADIDGFVATQRRLLAALYRLLRPGGRIVYATCSVLRAENGRLIEGFMAGMPGVVDVTGSARLEFVDLPPAPEDGPGYALLPGIADTDGFFYACLESR
jgi:16S rRNA (cytosine967-C5)-methyltransferase